MPNNIIKHVHEVCDIEIDELEKRWAKAEKIAEDKGKKEDYSYIMGIFKNELPDNCLKKLNWKQAKNIFDTFRDKGK